MEATVFNMDSVREAILDFAVHTSNGEDVCRETLRSVRLVQKSWAQTTTKLLHMSKEPLYVIQLNKDNSLSCSTMVQQGGKILDQFTNRLISPSAIDNRFPTFRLEILEECFRQENYKSFLNCLTFDGGSLVELELHLPLNGGSLIWVFPHLFFPVLEKLTVHLSETKLEELDEGEAIVEHSFNVTSLINSLLNAASSLKELVFPSFDECDLLPLGFEYLTFPQSLRELEISHGLTTAHHTLLMENPLPNLVSLELLISNEPIPDDKLFRILENVGMTLTHFILTGIMYHGLPRSVTFIRFPVMESLESLTICSIYCELHPDLLPLQNCFPNIDTLVFTDQTVESFQKLTETSIFPNVDDLMLELVNENMSETDNEWVECLDLEKMQSVHTSFPNVQVLELRMSARKICGLKYLFMEMTQLKTLTIRIANGADSDLSQDLWDALMIGAPREFVTGLRRSPMYFWKDVNFETSNIPSIRMLTNLKDLYLAATSLLSSKESLISDITFYFALMKMPKLRRLSLVGRFSASESVTQKWREEGRFISYTPGKEF